MAAYAAAASLKHKIATIIHHYDVLLDSPFLKILKVAERELRSFQEFLQRLDSRRRMNPSIGRTAEEIRRFEDVFQFHWDKLCESFNGDRSQRLLSVDLVDLKQHTDSLMETLKKTKEEEYWCDLPEGEYVSSSRSTKMVGLRDEYNKLKEELVGDWVEHPFFSLVGMTGIGKTSLARKIFEDLDIVEWFEYRVWLVIEVRNEDDIPRAILAQVEPDAHQMLTKGYKEISEYLTQKLMEKRYLIVMDDVWNSDARYGVQRCIPYSKSGGRVLLTTRNWNVAKHIMFCSHTLHVRLLNKEESWDLLRDKVFGEGYCCPPELEKAGKKIAEKCDGLPLTIITIARLLAKAVEAPETLWIEVATQKKHKLFVDAYDEISEVFYTSYNTLSENTKSCFLYMGMFRQNYQIPKSDIVILWVVERVFGLDISETLEESAVFILLMLATNSFVMVHERSTSTVRYYHITQAIKMFSLHTSWWYFSHKEARKNNFFHVLDSYKDASGEVMKGHSRLSINNNVLFGIKDVYNSIEENCAPTAHSLLCLGPYHQYPVPICFGLKLLKTLRALEIRFYEFPLEVLKLVKLRYLALTCNGELPPSISRLLKLKFLIVNQHWNITYESLSRPYLPLAIWDMKKLKHIQVMGYDLPDPSYTSLPELLRLSNVSEGSCTKRVLRRIPNVKKIGIHIEIMLDQPSEPLCCFDYIRLLRNLESLTCVVVNPECKSGIVALRPRLPIFPSTLKKLCLSGLGYPWEETSKIASLQNLEVLKLRRNAFEGPDWEIEDDGFRSLKILLIEDSELVQVKAGSGSFCELTKLSIKHCYKLKEFQLRHYETLPDIEVVDCNPLLEKEIKATILESSKLPEHLSVRSSWKS